MDSGKRRAYLSSGCGAGGRNLEITDMLLAGLGLFLGGVLKGATGAGAPIIGVPVLAMLFNVPTAVALFTIPNLLTNISQGWQFRAHLGRRGLATSFALWGALGALAGSVLLAVAPATLLMAGVGVVVLSYIGFRVLRPDWRLAPNAEHRLTPPAGFIGGLLQGAGGISAPVSVTYLNALRLERPRFIATISIFFCAMSLVQIPALYVLGILTPQLALLGFVTLGPLLLGMPVGNWLAQRVSKDMFDKIILVLLAVIAAKLLFDGLFV